MIKKSATHRTKIVAEPSAPLRSFLIPQRQLPVGRWMRDRIVANYYLRYTSRRFVVHRQWRLLFIVHHIAVAVARSYSGTGRAGCTGAWRYSFTSTVTQLNGKESRGGRVSARVRASVSACVCVEMQNGHGTPQGEVYRGALSYHFPLLLFSFFFIRRGFYAARR